MTTLRGVLLDNHYSNFAAILARAWRELDYDASIADSGFVVVSFADLGLAKTLDDRSLWQFCQTNGYVLLSDNRNAQGEDSLARTIMTTTEAEHLPVLTPGNRERAQNDRAYQLNLAASVAEILTGIESHRQFLGVGRIYIPLPQHLT